MKINLNISDEKLLSDTYIRTIFEVSVWGIRLNMEIDKILKREDLVEHVKSMR